MIGIGDAVSVLISTIVLGSGVSVTVTCHGEKSKQLAREGK
jgi:hypothetical protein